MEEHLIHMLSLHDALAIEFWKLKHTFHWPRLNYRILAAENSPLHLPLSPLGRENVLKVIEFQTRDLFSKRNAMQLV